MTEPRITWPDEVRPGDVIVTMYGERRHVRRVVSLDWQGAAEAVIESYVRGHDRPQTHTYDLTRTIRVEKGE